MTTVDRTTCRDVNGRPLAIGDEVVLLDYGVDRYLRDRFSYPDQAWIGQRRKVLNVCPEDVPPVVHVQAGAYDRWSWPAVYVQRAGGGLKGLINRYKQEAT